MCMGGMYTVVGYPLEGLLEELAPVEVESMKPWRNSAVDEGLCILVGILLLHRREARDADIGEVLAILAGTAGEPLAICGHCWLPLEFGVFLLCL